MFKNLTCILGIGLIVACQRAAVAAAEPSASREVHGVVVDEGGHPVPNADVALVWSANGTQRNEKGEVFDDVKKVWGNVGQLAPRLGRGVQTDESGKFTITMSPKRRTLMAMDRERRRGGLGVADPNQPNSPVKVTLHRLVQVKGSYRFQIEDVAMDWTYTKALVPETDERLVVCGSYARDFVIKLPPGAFVLEAHGEVVGCVTEKVRKKITLSRADSQVGVGVLEIKPGLAVQSRLEGKWGNLADYYGKEPPEWQIADARGVPKSVRIADFRGKWLLIEFWAPFCLPCITKNLPELARFYEEHGNQRKHFEIVAFCCHPETDDVDELYDRLRAAVERVWKGKRLPFPLLLDSERKTQQSYGISMFPTTVLVDPQGRLVEGGSLEMLGKKLIGSDDDSR